jgi:hypothetical protein
MPPGDPGDPGHQEPVTVRSAAIMNHQIRIEHIDDKDKLAWHVSAPSLAGQEPVMEGLTPALPDSLPPLGELIADIPFWRYRIGTAGEGMAHLRVWVTAGPEPGHLAWSPRRALPPGSPSPRSTSGPRSLAGTGPRSYCSSITLHPSSARAWRPWTWSASEPTAARTDCASGRPRRRMPVMPGSSCGWPFTAVGSSASQRVGLTGARPRKSNTATTALS